ncbi:hypothetical protein [Kutzneria kofuensis]|uniref:hypothetical protein n=1 Tax=Kutzneria kofuensis TaxID=103725 RepID=UPI0031ED25AF
MRNVSLALKASSGASVTPASVPTRQIVWPGEKIRVPFTVAIPASDNLFTTTSVKATADFRYLVGGSGELAAADSTTVNHPVTGPYQTFASTTRSSVRSVTGSAFRRRARTCGAASTSTARCTCPARNTTVPPRW